MTADPPFTRDWPKSERNRPEPAGTGRDLNTRTAAARNHGRPTVSGRLRLTGPDVMHWYIVLLLLNLTPKISGVIF